MTVKVETDAAQVATYFTGLHEASMAGVVSECVGTARHPRCARRI